ncbi:MAG: hypothetical protein LBC76_05605 [Treponema sp.]|jgi:uncharacterized membrane protein YcgQ (UPF0703/DUF1980 family)|nr:hypothetical protein [Treponema sp.]
MGRKLVIAAVLITVTALFLIGCSGTKKSEVSNDNIIVIKEKMFVSQINDIYLNAEDYLGKTIKLQGLFKEEKPYEGDPYCFVLRYGPGCCGFDGNVGFEIKWDENKSQPFPKEDSWIETTGILKQYEEDGYDQYLYLDLISLNVLNKRGAEIVYQ